MDITRRTIKKIQLTDEENTIINKAADILADLANEIPMNKQFRFFDKDADYDNANGADLNAAAVFLEVLAEWDGVEIED